MADLGSTLPGAILAVVGGFFATLYIPWLDRRRDDARAAREFRAAAILVDDEKQANFTGLSALAHEPPVIPEAQRGLPS